MVAVGIVIAALIVGSPKGSPSAALTTDPRDPDVIVGRVHVAAAPSHVWDRVHRVDEWARLFTDIRRLEIRHRGTERWTVDLESGALGCGLLPYDIQFKPHHAAHLRIEVPGAETEGTLSVSSEGTGARFEYRFRAHFARAGGCFGSERDLRDRQWRFLSAYVADVEKAFTTPGASR